MRRCTQNCYALGVVLALSMACKLRTCDASATAPASEATPAHHAAPPAPQLKVAAPECPPDAPFDPSLDAAWLQTLARGEIAELKPGRGGRSLGFRVRFTNGQRAYFKPAQGDRQAHHHAEIAAFHLDRLLGLCRVTPVAGRRIAKARLQAATPDTRVRDLNATDSGVPGAMIAWITPAPKPLNLQASWLACIRREGHGEQPFKGFEVPRAADARVCNAPGVRPHLDGLRDLIVFDYLIANVDRWSANRSNLRRLGPDGPLIFFDHGEAFWQAHFLARLEGQLAFLDAPTHSLRAALVALDLAALRTRLASDALGPVLSAHLLEGLALRHATLRDGFD